MLLPDKDSDTPTLPSWARLYLYRAF